MPRKKAPAVANGTLHPQDVAEIVVKEVFAEMSRQGEDVSLHLMGGIINAVQKKMAEVMNPSSSGNGAAVSPPPLSFNLEQ